MEIDLKYNGPALETGRMSARELGPAIFGMAELLERTSEILYRDDARLRVDVQGNFRRGSFLVNFVAGPTADLIGGLTAEQLGLILSALGINALNATQGLIAFFRWLRGRKIKAVAPLQSSGDVNVTVVEGDQTIIHNTIFLLAKDARIRNALQGITEPLSIDGIESVELGPEGDHQVIEKAEAAYFARNVGPSPDTESFEHAATLEVIGPMFKAGNKWRFEMAGVQIHASIEDAGFLDRVNRHDIRFGPGDRLKVWLRTTTTKLPNGNTKHERIITRVDDYIEEHRVIQGELPRVDDDDDDGQG